MKHLMTRSATASDLPAMQALLGRSVQLPTLAHEQLLVAQAEPAEGGPARVLATLRLQPAIGLALPRCWYHVGCTVHAAPELGLFHRQRTLLLGHDHTGASELCDIAWQADELPLDAQAAALRLLVASACLLLARQRGAYAQRLIVELPGLRDAAGQSPFWQGLGRHFYSGDPAAAAQQHGLGWRSHVAALLPRQPLYAEFLPAAAQAAIGQVHPPSLVLREVLEAAGLRYGHHVNVEDAGPVLDADTDALHGLATARAWRWAASPHATGGAPMLLMLQTADGWRALRAGADAQGQRLLVTEDTAARLGLAQDDAVWALPAT
jgi:arginine N-succinyltransferase